MQIVAGTNAVDERLPVAGMILRRAVSLVACRTRRRAGVAKITTQQIDDIVDQLLRFRRADFGQVIARDVGEIA